MAAIAQAINDVFCDFLRKHEAHKAEAAKTAGQQWPPGSLMEVRVWQAMVLASLNRAGHTRVSDEAAESLKNLVHPRHSKLPTGDRAPTVVESEALSGLMGSVRHALATS